VHFSVKFGIGLLGLVSMASAALVTSAVGPVVADFNQFAGLGYNFQNGPTQVQNGTSPIVITWTAAGGQQGGGVLGQGSYGLAGNGSWGSGGQTYTAVDNAAAQITMMFSAPVSGVSMFVNYCPDCGGTAASIAALDSGGNIIESYDLTVSAPISTPGGQNAGAYRGITHATSDIWGFEIFNMYMVGDDLTVTGAASGVPEPTSGLLALGGLAGILIQRLRRRS